MPSPHLPPGFDPTDPDICVKALPVEEFAELRKAAPIWWCEQTPGHAGGFRARAQAAGAGGGAGRGRRACQHAGDLPQELCA